MDKLIQPLPATSPAPQPEPTPIVSRKYTKLLLRLAMLKNCAVLVLLDEHGNPSNLMVMPKMEGLR